MSKATALVHQQEHKSSTHVPCGKVVVAPNDERKSVEYIMYKDQQKNSFHRNILEYL